MIEHGDALLTWQLDRPPTGSESLPIRARRIGDHRRAYLEYEGDISGGRGAVRRVDRGCARIVELTEQRCRFLAEGSRLSGRFRLETTDGESWSLAADAGSTVGDVPGDDGDDHGSKLRVANDR